MQAFLEKIKVLPLVSIIITFIAFVAFYTGLFKPIDNAFYDILMAQKAYNNINSEIVIVEIDTKSINELGRWPWKRYIHANLLNKLKTFRPKVIGINILFSEPSEDDEAFIEAFKGTENIVLAFSQEKNSILFPIPQLKSLVKIADVHVSRDDDGIIRKAYKESLYLPDYTSFASEITNNYSPGIKKNIPETKVFNINYLNTTDSFLHFSFSDVLSDKVNPEIFKDKIVLIDVTAEGIAKSFNTPLTNRLEKNITGIELQAHIINTILNNKFLYPVSYLFIFLSLLILSVSLELFLSVKKPLIQGIAIFLVILLVLLTSYFLFNYLSFWLTPTVFIVSSMLLYLILLFKTLFKIDQTVGKTISELSVDGYFPLTDISNQVEQGVYNLSQLSQFINKDRQMIQAILDAINSPVLVVDKDFNIIWRNKEANLLNSLENIMSLSSLEIDFEMLKSKIVEDNYYKQEISLNDKDYLFISTPSGEDKTDFVCVFNDITELKNLDRLKTDLMRTVSHEIRTPLTIIQSYCDLGIELEDGIVALDYLNKISNKTEELTDLVSDFLDLNKLEANMVVIKLVPVDVLSLISNIVEEIKELADTKKIKIILNNTIDNDFSVLGDKSRLKQVFMNLISNAIKYSDEDKKIIISFELQGNRALITFADEGFGMGPEDLVNIFQKFYRVRSEKTNEISGTGLGLAIVKKIIDMHNGEIHVSSTPGEGTTFEVCFDLVL